MNHRQLQKQQISVPLPQSAKLKQALELCGNAIRNQQALMLRSAPIGMAAGSRLVSLEPDKAIYEVWLYRVREAA